MSFHLHMSEHPDAPAAYVSKLCHTAKCGIIA